MARLVTGAKLLAQARQLADQVGATYIKDADGYDSLQHHLGEYTDMLLLEDPDFFPALYKNIEATGAEEYAAPLNLGSVIGVDRRDGDTWIALEPFMITERNNFPVTGGGPATRYRMNGEAVELRPKPDSGTYRWVYHAVPQTIDAETVINDVCGWTRMIVFGCALDMKTKEGTDASLIVTERDKFWPKLLERISRRQATAPKRIRDLHAEQGLHDPADFWPRRGAS